MKRPDNERRELVHKKIRELVYAIQSYNPAEDDDMYGRDFYEEIDALVDAIFGKDGE